MTHATVEKVQRGWNNTMEAVAQLAGDVTVELGRT
jgi:hypothetical protein